MNKYLLFAISTISSIHCMEQAYHEPQNFFTNLTVLDYDGNANYAYDIAKTAKMVHSDTTGKKLADIIAMKEKYAHVNNLRFTIPQLDLYDVVTIHNPNLLNKKEMFHQLGCFIKKYLKSNGEVHALIQTQKHYPSIHEIAFLELYPHIYKLLSLEKQQQINPQFHHPAVKLQSHYLTDEKAKDTIWSCGYDIISCRETIYEEIMTTAEIKKMLKSNLLDIVQECDFSQETKKLLSKQYVSLVLNQCKKNLDLDQVIIPFKVTKIHLHNTTESMRLRLNRLYPFSNYDKK